MFRQFPKALIKLAKATLCNFVPSPNQRFQDFILPVNLLSYLINLSVHTVDLQSNRRRDNNFFIMQGVGETQNRNVSAEKPQQ